MLSDFNVVGSDDYLLYSLASELGEGLPRLARLRSYRDGSFVVPVTAPPASREAYQRFASRARLAFGDTIVTQTSSRLIVRGFRTAVDNDLNGDREASKVMRENHLAVQFRDLMDAKSLYGCAYGLVGLDESGYPFVTVRDGWTVAARMDRVRPWLVDAAVMAGFDEVEGLEVLTLMRAGQVRVAVREAESFSVPSDGGQWSPGTDWSWQSDWQSLGFTDRCPVVRFSNPDLMGEFERHIDSIDRVSEDILQRLTITAMQAFRQRAVIAGEGGFPEFYPDDHSLAGQRVDYNDMFENSPGGIWMMPNGVSLWESAPTDIHALNNAESKDLEHLAAVTATPLYSLSPNVNQSAEGAKLSRETIQAKIRDRQVRDAESFAELMGLAFEAYGMGERAVRSEIETMWAPQEVVRRSDVAEAARAAKQAGKSHRFIDEHIFELTPDEMSQEELNRRDELLESGAFAADVSGVDGVEDVGFGAELFSQAASSGVEDNFSDS